MGGSDLRARERGGGREYLLPANAVPMKARTITSFMEPGLVIDLYRGAILVTPGQYIQGKNPRFI